jgi:hypothetical protein
MMATVEEMIGPSLLGGRKVKLFGFLEAFRFSVALE